MKTKMSVFADGYFQRMALTLFLGLCIPIICAGFLMLSGSFRELQSNNQQHYISRTLDSILRFEDTQRVLRNHALSVAYEKQLVRASIEENNYYAKKSTELLRRFRVGLDFTQSMCIYFQGGNYVLTSDGFKYTLEQYAAMYGGEDAQLREKIHAFITEGHGGNMSLLSTFPYTSSSTGVLMVGVPVSFGGTMENDGLIFYLLDRESIDVPVEDGELYIYDEDGTLLITTAREDALRILPAYRQFVGAAQGGEDSVQNTVEFESDGQVYTAFRVQDWSGRLSYVSMVRNGNVQSYLAGFYRLLRSMFLVVLGMLTVMFAGTLYINYKPIWRLVCRIRESAGDMHTMPKNGLSYIEENWARIHTEQSSMQGQLAEQRMILVYYTLSALLRGRTVGTDERAMLDFDFGKQSVLVVSAVDMRLDNAQRQDIEAEMLEGGVQTYIVDIPRESHLVFVCLYDRERAPEEIGHMLQTLLTKSVGGGTALGCAAPVDCLGDLRGAYLQSLRRLEEGRGAGEDDVQLHTVIMDFVLCVHQGYTDEAQARILVLAEYIEDKYIQPMMRRYAFFEVIREYAAALKKLSLQTERDAAARLIDYADTQDFICLLSASVCRACEEVQRQKSMQKQSLYRDILCFVDERFASPEMTLTYVADHFHMSIYTMSRVFKEISGIGFKEYVTTKKLEEGRRLLLGTDMSIREIAETVELYSADYFTRLFKKCFGMPPNNYRILARREKAGTETASDTDGHAKVRG